MIVRFDGALSIGGFSTSSVILQISFSTFTAINDTIHFNLIQRDFLNEIAEVLYLL